MMTSAMSDISRRSRGVRLSVFGSDQQNLTQFLQLAQKTTPFAVVPQYSIRGTVSQLDKAVQKTSGSFGATLAESVSGIRLGSDTRFAVMGLDAAVVQTDSMTLMPGVVSKNTTVLVSRDARAEEGLARLVRQDVGLVFSMATSRADGPAQAARNMVELATVELVGRLIKAPYWQCLGLADDDPEVQREMDDWFLSMDDGERIRFYKERLRESCYYDGSRLLTVAMRITQDKALAKDIVQEVLVTVWHQTAVRAPGQSLSLAWLCVVTRHRAIDLMRKTRPTVPLTWLDSEGEEHQHEVPDETGSPLTQLLNHEDDHQLSRCLNALDDQPRQAMLLGFYEGLTHIEISARMSKPLGTVKAWVRRSLMSLKVCMEAAA